MKDPFLTARKHAKKKQTKKKKTKHTPPKKRGISRANAEKKERGNCIVTLTQERKSSRENTHKSFEKGKKSGGERKRFTSSGLVEKEEAFRTASTKQNGYKEEGIGFHSQEERRKEEKEILAKIDQY